MKKILEKKGQIDIYGENGRQHCNYGPALGRNHTTMIKMLNNVVHSSFLKTACRV